MADAEKPRRTLSLTWRLVGGYTLGAIITLSLVSVFLHRSLWRMFEIEDTELLSDCVTAVRTETRKRKGDLHEAREIISESAGTRQIEKYYGRLMDSSGRVLVITNGADGFMPPPEDFPPPVAVDQPVKEITERTAPNGTTVWIASALVEVKPGQPPMVFHVVLDIRHVEQWLADYRDQLIVMVAVASAATAFMACFITCRGLRPLADIASAAQRITASGLDERVGGNVWPRELASLAVEFDRMLDRLRESFERLSQFTADAAHEFRTPLNNLLGGTSLALARPRTAEEYSTLLEANLEEYHRLNHMIGSLLFLARADNARAVLNPADVDAAEAIAEVVEFFSALAEDRQVTLSVSGGGRLHADPALLRMGLTNLVSNAMRYAPSGSTIHVSAAPVPGGGMALTVRDEGPGIAAEHLPRLFDRFYRVDGSRASDGSNQTGNSGLGLALVKTIMTLHGGSVSVESEPGAGATFRMLFPGERVSG